jgi:antirestriction protein ArdC
MNKVYQVITDRIVSLLEAGTVPWHRPWDQLSWPKNLVSGKEYRGINPFLLSCTGFDSSYWVTYKQAKQKGGCVKKGEKGFPVIFWKLHEKEDAETGEQKKLPVLRYYTVFNVSQCDDIEAPESERTDREFSPIEACEKVVYNWPTGPQISFSGDRAFYRPSTDTVTMPKPERFHSNEEYYGTLFHELTHSTGHEKRLARPGVADLEHHTFGDMTYSKEELIAEMGAAFLAGHTGIERTTLDNSAAYLAGWLRILKKDAKLVVLSAAAAQRAADMILGKTFTS